MLNLVIVLDVSGIEDNYGQVDIAIATIGGTDKIVLLQIDGILTPDEFSKAMDLGVKGCSEVFEKQKEALKSRYASEGGDEE